MPNKIGIIGFALVGFEDDVKLRSDELVFKATKAALDMAGIKRRDLDVSVITSIDAYDGITISNGLMAPAGGGYQKDATRIQGGGVAAVESAYASILSNSAELAVVAGADAVRYDDTVISNAAYDPFFRRPIGLYNVSSYALVAASLLRGAGLTEKDLAQLAANNYQTATGNANAHRKDNYSVDDILASPMVSWPLRELEIAPISKGGAALVLASEEKTRELTDDPLWITGVGGGSNQYYGDWPGLLEMNGLRRACKNAYKLAGVTDPAAEIDVVEIFNPFSSFEVLAVEALGLCQKDQTLDMLLREDKTVNTSGGTLSTNPPGCGGLYRTIQGIKNLKKDEKAQRAVVQDSDINLGFFGETYHVLVMEKGGK